MLAQRSESLPWQVTPYALAPALQVMLELVALVA